MEYDEKLHNFFLLRVPKGKNFFEASSETYVLR